MANAPSTLSPERLYADAVQCVEQSQPQEALSLAKQLWAQVQSRSPSESLPALMLLGEISIELGEVEAARGYFEHAVRLDPHGELPEALGGGAEKFLWLAQLCDDGGKQSVQWYQQGAQALQREIANLENGSVPGLDPDQLLVMRIDKKHKLANALCGIVEVYMTDLSWEDDAEAHCEHLMMEAMAIEDEPSPEVLQTLASVRLSQQRIADSQSALQRSLAAWIDLAPEDPAVPDFATKISLSRLLMEARMESDAMRVLDRLVQEDDQSVEAWYLGGWCQYLLAEQSRETAGEVSSMDTADDNKHNPATNGDDYQQALRGSRWWLATSLNLYEQLDYEDARLYDHAKQLVEELDKVLGPEESQPEGGEEWDEEWNGIQNDTDASEDEDMDL